MTTPFSNFLTFPKKFSFWKKPGNQVVGVDVGLSSIKMVQLRRDRGRAILETYGELATGPYRDLGVGQATALPPDRLQEALTDLIKEANITTKEAVFAIPLSSSLLIVMEIPAASESTLNKVVPLEARKYIPVPVSEVALDWWPLPRSSRSEESEEGNGKASSRRPLKVLAVAVHKNVINQYQNLAKAVNLRPAFFEIETFAALRSIFGGELAATAMIDIGAGTTKLAIVDFGVVRLSHTIGKGSQDISVALSRTLGVDFAKAEEIKRQVGLVERLSENRQVVSTVSNVLEYIFAEANKVIADYQAKNRKAVNKIVFIGSGALLKGLLELAGKNFEVPVELGKPFDKVEAPEFLRELLAKAGPGFAGAIGLGLRYLQNLE